MRTLFILEDMQKFIEEYHPLDHNVPVFFGFSGNAKVMVKYSLGDPKYFDSIEDGLNHIKDFIKNKKEK